MNSMNSSAEHKLTNHAIQLPANPFWSVFKTFGRDELLAGICSVAGTGALGLLITGTSSGEKLALAVAGPVVEKFGFFLGHIKDVRDIYRATPKQERKNLTHYAKIVVKGGGNSLLWDVLIHDPLYVVLMLLGMHFHPTTPAWLLVPIAFIVAVLIVTFGQVFLAERRYNRLIRNLHQKGYEQESYLESRFYLPAEIDSAEVIQDLRNIFLPGQNIAFMSYTDIYYSPSLEEYNARCPQMRIRERTHGEGFLRTAQIIYTRATEHSNQDKDQFRFFPQQKDKLYCTLPRKLPLEQACEEHRPAIQSFLDACKNRETSRIKFNRAAVYDSNKLFLAVDSLIEAPMLPGAFYKVIEIKVYPNNVLLLKKAMAYVMHKYPVLQTTRGKYDLFIAG